MLLKNNQELIIEKAKLSDAKSIIEYMNLIGGESDNLSFGENEFFNSINEEIAFIKETNSSKLSVLLVGKINSEIVSVGSILTSKKKRFEHQGDLSVSVKKAYWNLGIGTLMMQTLIDFAKANKTTEIIHLEVRADNHYAIEMYKKFGFEPIGTYKKFFKIGDEYADEIFMNLYLK